LPTISFFLGDEAPAAQLAVSAMSRLMGRFDRALVLCTALAVIRLEVDTAGTGITGATAGRRFASRSAA